MTLPTNPLNLKPQIISLLPQVDADLYLLKEYLVEALERHDILIDKISLERQDSTIYVNIRFYVLGLFQDAELKDISMESSYFKKYTLEKKKNLFQDFFSKLGLKKSRLMSSKFLKNLKRIKKKTVFRKKLLIKNAKNREIHNSTIKNAKKVLNKLKRKKLKKNILKSFQKLVIIRKKFQQKEFFEALVKKYLSANNLSKNWVVMLNLTPIHHLMRTMRYPFEDVNEESFNDSIKKFADRIFSKKSVQARNDFIIIALLFAQGKVSPNLFFEVIVTSFNYLFKAKHSAFFKFIEEVFEAILELQFNVVNGLQLVISGKISGKTMASTKKISVGTVWNESTLHLQKHRTNRIGTFGYKFTIYKIPRLYTAGLLYMYSSHYSFLSNLKFNDYVKTPAGKEKVKSILNPARSISSIKFAEAFSRFKNHVSGEFLNIIRNRLFFNRRKNHVVNFDTMDQFHLIRASYFNKCLDRVILKDKNSLFSKVKLNRLKRKKSNKFVQYLQFRLRLKLLEIKRNSMRKLDSVSKFYIKKEIRPVSRFYSSLRRRSKIKFFLKKK